MVSCPGCYVALITTLLGTLKGKFALGIVLLGWFVYINLTVTLL